MTVDFSYSAPARAAYQGILLGLIEELSDDEECHYDHDDFCQTHYYDRPCANERAKRILDGHRSSQPTA